MKALLEADAIDEIVSAALAADLADNGRRSLLMAHIEPAHALEAARSAQK